jgi:tripartite-type tricarboxylate transporter receptor subunit TctC
LATLAGLSEVPMLANCALRAPILEGTQVTNPKLSRRQFLYLGASASVLPAMSQLTWAQAYPSRPVTLLVPYPAGGGADSVGRIMAEHMRTALGQPVIIENVPGATGSIGVGRVARARPDGYTFVLGNWNTHVVNGAVYALPYDVLSDFEPVALLLTFYPLLVAKKALPANNLKELVDWLKANPDKASSGTTGAGGQGHLAGVLLRNLTSTRFQQVPYRGNAPAMQDLVSGQIDFMFADQSALAQVNAGSIKAIAVIGRNRLLAAPDIPTAEESGFAGLSLANWNAIFAPKGTPKDIVGTLNEAAVRALADPNVVQRLVDLGNEIPPSKQQTPEALAALQKAEIEKWWPIIKAANIKAE